VLSPEQLATVPLHVIGYTTSSDIPGMGHTTLDFDFSRPVSASDVAATRQQEFFPAVQTMRLHILVSTDAFKGKTLRSMSPSALRNAAWRDVPAVRAGRVFVIRDELLNTPGPPLVEGARQLFFAIHHEAELNGGPAGARGKRQ